MLRPYGYLQSDRRGLRTAELALADGDTVSAANRADYAIFYAANPLLELDRPWEEGRE